MVNIRIKGILKHVKWLPLSDLCSCRVGMAKALSPIQTKLCGLAETLRTSALFLSLYTIKQKNVNHKKDSGDSRGFQWHCRHSLQLMQSIS